ncbi:MAG: hypothetical protein WCK35_01065 [Chloroflexota bacterium]
MGRYFSATTLPGQGQTTFELRDFPITPEIQPNLLPSSAEDCKIMKALVPACAGQDGFAAAKAGAVPASQPR